MGKNSWIMKRGLVDNIVPVTIVGWFVLGVLVTYLDLGVLRSLMFYLSLVVPVALLLAFKHPMVRSFFWVFNTFHHWIVPTQVSMFDHVMKNAKEGDAMSIVNEIDKFCWDSKQLIMNVGDVKGKIVDEAIKSCRPKVSCELGAHIGYSTLRIAAQLQEGAVLHSVDPDPFSRAILMGLVDFAGPATRKKIVHHYDYSGNALRKLAQDNVKLDFLFIDHVKELYLEDLQLVLSLKLLKKGSVVVADNVLFPGAPEYKEWILKQKCFKTTVHDTFVEYSTTIKDQVLVSEYLGE